MWAIKGYGVRPEFGFEAPMVWAGTVAGV